MAGNDHVIVVGHKNPDTDAVISAIAFSYYLSKIGFKAKPYVAGSPSPETLAILEKTGLSTPEFISDVRVKAGDVMTRNVYYARIGEPVKKAIDTLVEKSIRSMPIVDEKLRVVGLFSVEGFARKLIEEISREKLILDRVPVENFLQVSGSTIVRGYREYLSGEVIVASRETPADRVRGAIVVASEPSAAEKAVREGAYACIITGFSGEISVEDGFIIHSPHDVFTTLRMLDLSQPVERYSEKPVIVSSDELLSNVKDVMSKGGVRTVVVAREDGVLEGIITRSDLVRDYRRRVALVDHNEFSQSVDGVEEARIIAVVDHHRIGGDVETRDPIIFRVEPVGSTCTVIWRMMVEEGIEIPRNLAEAMLYAILSDTMLLKSPTKTKIDYKAVENLALKAGVRVEGAVEFTRIAMTANQPMDPKLIVERDYKEYVFNNYRIGVSQVLTPNSSSYLNMISEITRYMREYASRRSLNTLILMITDFIDEKSIVVAVGDKRIVEEALGLDLSKGYCEVKGLVSRKKQLIPKIMSYFEKKP